MAQESNSSGWTKKLESFKLKTSVGFQLWSSYTFDEAVYNSKTGQYDRVDNRMNVQLRRSRLTFKGQPYEDLQFNLTAAFDLVGRDVLAGTEAGANNGSSPQLRLWNAYVQWRVLHGSEKLNIVGGYFVPQFGRESMTAALQSTSMEKAWSQNYLRRHLTGIGPGRAFGINAGGLFAHADSKLALGYDAGIFTPVFEGYSGNSVGKQYSPMLTGRLTVHIGDPESRTYTVSHKINYFGKRKGLTIGLAGSAQGQTDLFKANSALGVDVLLNLGHLTLDGDWSRLVRKGHEDATDVSRDFTVNAGTGYIRMGYNIYLKNGYVLEPLAMFVRYNGETDAQAQADAASVKSPSGEEQIIDLGVNLFFNPDLKLSLHYTLRDAAPGAAGNGATVNNYFTQDGVGAIHRGDWLGLGLVAIF